MELNAVNMMDGCNRIDSFVLCSVFGLSSKSVISLASLSLPSTPPN